MANEKRNLLFLKENILNWLKNPPVMDYGWGLDGDRVAIKQITLEKTAGGIFIPDSSTDEAKPKLGFIAEMGYEVDHLYDEQDKQWKKDPSNNFFPGQLVSFGKYAGSETFGMDGEEYLVMRKNDLHSFIKPSMYESLKA